MPRPILATLLLNLAKHMVLKDLKDLCLSTPPLQQWFLVEFHNAWPSHLHRLLILATEDLRRHHLLTSPIS